MDRASLERALERLGRPRVLIVGDVMLDRYVSGEVSRISPEAPIPVLAAKSSEQRLGGSGNVAANLAAMEAAVELVAVVGDDVHGEVLRTLLGGAAIDAAGLVVDESRPTIRKTRLVSGVQQMLRVDREDPTPVEGPVEERVLAAAREAVGRADAVVLSDYGKGLLTPAVNAALIAAARERGIPCLVDPKGSDWGRYQGATLVTPNRKEAEEALKNAKSDIDLAKATSELAVMAAQIAALRKYRQKK